MKTESCDVLVIGAGPAGSVAAAQMHRAGFNVRVVEKEKFPRFVIGESLLPRCMEVLDDCNLLEAVKAKGFQEKFGAKFVKGDQVSDFNFSEQFTPGAWKWTWQVPRAEFDTTLINTVASWGVKVDFETSVTAIQFFDDESSMTTIQKLDGSVSSIKAKFIIDASGYGRVIPRLFNLDTPSSLTPRKAVFAHLEDHNRSQYDEPNRIIVLNYAPETWVWIIPFSSGITSMGFVGKHEFFDNEKSLTEQYNTLIERNEYLNKRFGQSKRIFEPRKLEGWSTKTDKFFGKGFVLTGNVTEFLDPIFSSGVMFATVSSHLASKLAIKKMKGENVDWQKEYTQALQAGVDTFKAFVSAWYDGTLERIFYHPNQEQMAKKYITSILAGYVWDMNNPFVQNPDAALKRLIKLIDFEERMNALSTNG